MYHPDPILSIVIPCLNSPLIGQVIAALDAQTARDQIREVIVVGQDCYDHVPPHITFLRTERPISAAAARNRGAHQASSEILLFIDSDCIAAPDLIEQTLRCHTQGRTIVCGGVIPTGTSYWTLCDNLLVFAEFLATSPSGPRDFLPSLNFSISRALFIAFGGFDERYPGAAGEDLDFSLRLREAGYQLYFAPAAQIVHQHRRTNSREIWEHLRSFGRAHMRVARTRPTLQQSRVMRLPTNVTALIMAAALPLACLDVIGLFATHTALWPYASALPGMIWAKSGWYWGVAEGLFATSNPHGYP
jgi:GT2 family glycosyltransferase